jgi:hypothetical protein
LIDGLKASNLFPVKPPWTVELFLDPGVLKPPEGLFKAGQRCKALWMIGRTLSGLSLTGPGRAQEKRCGHVHYKAS